MQEIQDHNVLKATNVGNNFLLLAQMSDKLVINVKK